VPLARTQLMVMAVVLMNVTADETSRVAAWTRADLGTGNRHHGRVRAGPPTDYQCEDEIKRLRRDAHMMDLKVLHPDAED
jgi:hypothetical protein